MNEARDIAIAALDTFKDELVGRFIDLCNGNDFNKLKLEKIYDTIDEIYDKHIEKWANVPDRPRLICKNCGREFEAKRRDAFYCEFPSPQNPNVSCRDYCRSHISYEREKSDARLLKIRQMRSAKWMRVKRHPDNGEFAAELTKFKQEASDMVRKIKNGLLSEREFTEWVNNWGGNT